MNTKVRSILAELKSWLATLYGEPLRQRRSVTVLACGRENRAVAPVLEKPDIMGEEGASPFLNCHLGYVRDIPLRASDSYAIIGTDPLHGIYAYDAYYLHCAASLRSPLLTLDQRLFRVAVAVGVKVMEVKR